MSSNLSYVIPSGQSLTRGNEAVAHPEAESERCGQRHHRSYRLPVVNFVRARLPICRQISRGHERQTKTAQRLSRNLSPGLFPGCRRCQGVVLCVLLRARQPTDGGAAADAVEGRRRCTAWRDAYGFRPRAAWMREAWRFCANYCARSPVVAGKSISGF